MSRKPRVYLAQPMGSRVWREVLREAHDASRILFDYGLEVWSPALKETGHPIDALITTPIGPLRAYWKEDLHNLRYCDALLSLRGDLVSEGVGLEIGVAKYHHDIPVVIVSPRGPEGRVTHIEASYIAPTVTRAAEWLRRKLERTRKKTA